MSSDGQPPRGIRYAQLGRDDLARIGDIDRTERIDTLYVQRGTELVELSGDFSARPWGTTGGGEHSVAGQREACERYLVAGATAIGAFDGERLVAIGIVLPHVRSEIAQLAYMHVSDGYRCRGIGARLSSDLDRIAREAGDTEMVVSATPSENTVRFYLRRGFVTDAEPLPELLELEPDDVHMRKRL